MLHECRGEWEAALRVYDEILEKAPAHEGAHKRKVAVVRRARWLRELFRAAADARARPGRAAC